MTNCPICTGDAHPAMAARYGGCCSDSCWEIQDARAEVERLRDEVLMVRNDTDMAISLACATLEGKIRQLEAEAAQIAKERNEARAERDQARADGLLILEHWERQKGYEQLLRQAIDSLIDAIPGEGPCGGLPCDGLTAPCAICCAQAVLG